MKPLTNVFAGAFRIPEGHRLYRGEPAEVILIDEWGGQPRSTVEHEPKALLSLIGFCRNIEQQQGLSWRLLHFQNPLEVSSEEIEGWLNLTASRGKVH